jgi:hypothetical protein
MAQAERGSEVYATVDGWEIRAERDKSHCSMESWFTNKETGGTEGLLFLYYPHTESIVLSWGTSEDLGVPPNEYVDLAPHFHKPLGNGRSWLKRAFRHRQSRSDGMNYYIHVFRDPKETRRLLSDLSRYPTFVLYREGQVVAALPLGTVSTIDKLRDCTRGLPQSAIPAITE